MKINCSGADILQQYSKIDANKFLSCAERITQEKLNELNLLKNSPNVNFTLNFFTPSAMSEINSRYRNNDTATDVLSFPMWEAEDGAFIPPDDWEEIPLGDIIVCPDTVEKNAKENAKNFEQELSLVIFHGFLHLCGYDHDTEERQTTMWQQQDSMVAYFMEIANYD